MSRSPTRMFRPMSVFASLRVRSLVWLLSGASALAGCGTGPVDEPPGDGTPGDGSTDGSPDGRAGDGADEDGRDAGDDGSSDGSDGAGDGGADGSGDGAPEDAGSGDLPAEPPATSVPSRGSARTFDVGSWNIEWFGDDTNGPTDEAAQAKNAYEVLLGCGVDLWGVAEIVDGNAFARLVATMPGYRSLLADDVSVEGGSQSYRASEQKVGFVYREDIVEVESANLILRNDSSAFAGRPPLEAHLRVTIAGRSEPLVVIVVHAKAYDDLDAWQTRSEGAQVLKQYLDASYPTEKVLVIGDFNDVLDGSITDGQDSPYAAFVADSSDYYFVSSELTTGTTVGRRTAIDHHLLTDELREQYVAGSVIAYHVDQFVPNYQTTTSDHYPVLSRYDW